MQKITTTSELRAAIVELELKQQTQEKQVKEQFYAVYESFKTINLFKKVLLEVATSPGLISGMIGTVVELTRRKSKKHDEAASSASAAGAIFRSLLKSGVMKLIVENPDSLLQFGQYIIKRLFQHKEKKHKEKE
jgi:hypothetical protein